MRNYVIKQSEKNEIISDAAYLFIQPKMISQEFSVHQVLYQNLVIEQLTFVHVGGS